jgi:cytochrome b561
MAWLNHAEGYGGLTKAAHWAIVVLFAAQYASGLVMTRLPEGAAMQDALFNWHKTLGLVALAVASLRLWARHAGRLPDWAPGLAEIEKRLVHHAELWLYAGMLLLPVSGFLYVMAGGYGVAFAGLWELPNPLPRSGWLAASAKWVHVIGGVAVAVALAVHLAVVLRHAVLLRDGLLRRMLPRL